MRILPCLLALSLAAAGGVRAEESYVPKAGFKPVIVPRPGDKGVYTLLDAWREGPDRVVLVSKREGPSGINYTRRSLDCRRRRARDLGLGDTVAEMMRDKPGEPEWDLVDGSSADLVGRAACRTAAR
ncbi:hypothetical protein [Methylobacterium sp. sgz302541]|uniref:hypothetical protein n=1 Tax=unclassified Methylobacterium TaxID=2615210 RepID=UPI003D356F93